MAAVFTGAEIRTPLVAVTTAGYAAPLALLSWQALRGQSIVHLDPTSRYSAAGRRWRPAGPSGSERGVLYRREMIRVRLRAVRADDLPRLRAGSVEDDPFGFFGFTATNALERRFAVDGLISEDSGQLAVEDEDGTLLGGVGRLCA